MENVTLQQDAVVLSEKEYQKIIERINRLEKMVESLVTLIEDREDLQIMRETEAVYRTGDTVAFADLLAEVRNETELAD
jgi:hypothetical protein